MIVGIFGHHTGGTSAVAGVVRLLGYQMWGDPRTIDDIELRDALSKGIEMELIQERGTEWAFKHPLILKHAQHLIQRYNVKPIYVYRDPAAIWLNSGKTPTRDKIRESAAYFNEMAELPGGLYVSYEKLQTEKPRMIQAIADYIGKPYNAKAEEWVNNAKKYQKIEDFLN